ETGLRTARRISHAFIMDVPTYHKVLMITDAAINIAPTLEEKADICQNAVDLARTLGIELPKVAVLAAVETGNSRSTTRSARRPRTSRGFARRSRATPTSCSCPISKPATWSRSC